jgi:hypothetical protein
MTEKKTAGKKKTVSKPMGYAVVWGCSTDVGIIAASSREDAYAKMQESFLRSGGYASMKAFHDDYGEQPDPYEASISPKTGTAYLDDGDSPSYSANHESIHWKIVRV